MATPTVCSAFQSHPWIPFCRRCGQDESVHDFSKRRNQTDEDDDLEDGMLILSKADPAAWVKGKEKTLRDVITRITREVGQTVKTVERAQANTNGVTASLGDDGGDSIGLGIHVVAAARNKATASSLSGHLAQLSAERSVAAAHVCVAESARLHFANKILALEALLAEKGKGSQLTARAVQDKVTVLGILLF